MVDDIGMSKKAVKKSSKIPNRPKLAHEGPAKMALSNVSRRNDIEL